MDLLTADSILGAISGKMRAGLDALEVFATLESTNAYLLGQECPLPGRYRVALAEHQTKGRGRHNRRWVSPPSTGLCMSVAFTFGRMPDDFASLSLAIGIGIAQALENLGVKGVGLKWPNDLVAHDRKLGGVLPEVHPAKADSVTVVVGFGLNVDLRHGGTSTEIHSSLGRAIDVASCCDVLHSRAVIAAASIESLIDTMICFETSGFSHFLGAWQQYDWLRGRQVTIERAEISCDGIAGGVDADGALLLKSGGTTQRITSGSVILNGQSGTQP